MTIFEISNRFAAKQFTVRLGDIDLERNDEPSAPETYTVKQIHAHPKFSRVGFYNDIAVLELTRTVRKSPYVIPICLPQAHYRNERFAGARPTVVGWGTTYYGNILFFLLLFIFNLYFFFFLYYFHFFLLFYFLNLLFSLFLQELKNYYMISFNRWKRKYGTAASSASSMEKRRLQRSLFSTNYQQFSMRWL